MTLPLPDIWPLLALALFSVVLLPLGILTTTQRPKPEHESWVDTLRRIGAGQTPGWVITLGVFLWSLIFLSLVFGLIWTIISAALILPPQGEEEKTALRFILISLAGLTATTGAVIALPFTVVRLALTQKQADTAAEALLNDKINAAASDLAARRQVTRVIGAGTEAEQVLTEWEDDIVTRAAAIDRLEGLARENTDITPRVARQLSIYVRELSRRYPAQQQPKDATPEALNAWAYSLVPPRPDMEKAAISIGRLQRIDGGKLGRNDIDFAGANLQGFDLRQLSFKNARFEGAFLQGAILSRAELQGADFLGADLNGADLFETQLQRSDFSIKGLVSANYLDTASLRGATVKAVDQITILKLEPLWEEIFADGSVAVAVDDPGRPKHWPRENLGWDDFYTKWRAWLATLPPE